MQWHRVTTVWRCRSGNCQYGLRAFHSEMFDTSQHPHSHPQGHSVIGVFCVCVSVLKASGAMDRCGTGGAQEKWRWRVHRQDEGPLGWEAGRCIFKQLYLKAHSQLSPCIPQRCVMWCIYLRSSLMDSDQLDHQMRLIHCFNPCSDYHHNSVFLSSSFL